MGGAVVVVVGGAVVVGGLVVAGTVVLVVDGLSAAVVPRGSRVVATDAKPACFVPDPPLSPPSLPLPPPAIPISSSPVITPTTIFFRLDQDLARSTTPMLAMPNPSPREGLNLAPPPDQAPLEPTLVRQLRVEE